jgi:subtilisin
LRRAAPLALALLLSLPLAPAVSAGATRSAADGRLEQAGRAARADRPLSAEGRWIVVLKPGRSTPAEAARATSRGITVDRTFTTIHGYAARLTGAQVAGLRADSSVAAVVPDEVISIAGQSVPRGVRRIGGRESLPAGIDGSDERVDADVAIVDTGLGDPDPASPGYHGHEDLNIAGGYNCYDSKPDDGKAPNPNNWGDPNGHGTHVAGTVGALDNGIGVVGVAPGVRLWAVRILNSAGNGLLSWYVCGLDWIAAQRDPVDPTRPLFEAVNMSVAKSGKDDRNCGLTNKDVMHQAVCRVVAAGIPVVAAAGNNSFNAANLRPASYNEVITVSALADSDGRPGGLGGNLCYSWGTYDQDDTFADFSNYGGDVDLIAPGKCTYSTLPGNRYGWISGTSMAAPHVTGAIALYRASRPTATPAQVKKALIAAGTSDWDTATDPDSVHEPLLDVSHIVDVDDFTVDATPDRSRDALVGPGGATLALPVRLYRGEMFDGTVDLEVAADAPLAATLDTSSLSGLDGLTTSMSVTVPALAASGDYRLTVTATDRADAGRVRSSVYTVHVDTVAPVAAAPGALAITSTRLSRSSIAIRQSWPAGSDAVGAITTYQGRWIVDGVRGAVFTRTSTARSASRTVAKGHVYALEIRAGDAAGNWSPWVAGTPFDLAIIQDKSSTIRRSGTWRSSVKSAWSGGTAIFSRQKGAAVSRSFTGRGVAFVTSTGRYRGRAKIWIDGVYAGSVGLHASTLTARRLMFTRTWSTAGPHRITVVVAGTAGHPRVDLDAFVIVR